MVFHAKNTPRRFEALHASWSGRPRMSASTAHCNCWWTGGDANRFECTWLPSRPICFRVLPHPRSAAFLTSTTLKVLALGRSNIAVGVAAGLPMPASVARWFVCPATRHAAFPASSWISRASLNSPG